MTTKMSDRQNMPKGYVSKGGQAKGQTHHDSRDSIHTSEPNYMTTNKKALEFYVCVNNDEFNSKKITLQVNPRTTLDHILQECTEKIKPTFGAARYIHTGSGRHRVMNPHQLQKDGVYVLSGYESFNRNINYKDISERMRLPLPHKSKGYKKIDYERRIVPVQHAEKYRDKSGRSYYLNAHSHGLWLRVHVSGDSINPAHRVKVLPKWRGNLNKVKDEIKESIPFLNEVERIYKIHNCGGCLENFTEILDAGDLKSGDQLLAVTQQKPLKVDIYDPKGRINLLINTSRQNGFPSFHGFDSPVLRHNRSLNKHKVLPSIGKTSDSPYSSPGALGSSKNGGRNGRLSDRQNNRQKKAKAVDYDRDQGGVYRAKGQSHGHGAYQEDIRSNEKTTPIPKGTELNKQPSTEQKPNASEADNQTKSQEQMDDNTARQSVDEFADESFNRSYNNPSKTNNNEPRSSTPARGDDERRKKEQREHEAAERIQASMKGHLKRQERKQMKQEQKKQQNDIKADQMKDKNDTKKKQMTQDEAASKIQAGFKGYAVRKEQNLKKQQGQK